MSSRNLPSVKQEQHHVGTQNLQLAFITQPQGQIKDPATKRLVRQHARTSVLRARGGKVRKKNPPLAVRLAVPKPPKDLNDDLNQSNKKLDKDEGRGNTSVVQHRKTTSTHITYQPSVILPFQNDAESYYFSVFENKTSIELSGLFPSSFWTQIVLQESHHHSFIRHGLVAIAAFNRWSKSKPLLPLLNQNGFETQMVSNHRDLALQQYAYSLKSMRLLSPNNPEHLRPILIATLLVFLFETLIDSHPDVAFSHALIGDKLLSQMIQDTSQNSLTITSSTNNTTDDSIISTFTKFHLQMLTFIDIRPLSVHLAGKSSHQNKIDSMPTQFHHLSEAITYWEFMIIRSCHFILTLSQRNESVKWGRRFELSVPPGWGRVLEMNAQSSIYGSPWIVTPKIIEEASGYIEDLLRWTKAFSLLDKISHTLSLRDRTAILLMQLYTLSTLILLHGQTFTTESQYDQFLPQFQKIVYLASEVETNIIQIAEGKLPYAFHLNIVSPLWVVVWRCRDPELRRQIQLVQRFRGWVLGGSEEAIGMSGKEVYGEFGKGSDIKDEELGKAYREKMDGRSVVDKVEAIDVKGDRELLSCDGPWDRELGAKIGEWIAGLEEQDVDSDGEGEAEFEVEKVIKEEKRLRMSRVLLGMEKRGVMLQAVRRKKNEELEWFERMFI